MLRGRLSVARPFMRTSVDSSALAPRNISARVTIHGQNRAALQLQNVSKSYCLTDKLVSFSQLPHRRNVSTDEHFGKRCNAKGHSTAATKLWTISFWASRSVWERASLNTFRCLIGCTAGDFSSFWYLQYAYPDLGLPTSMAISMAAGVTTSMLLETWLLKKGKDKLSWSNAVKTAAGMSLTSMLAMEFAENLVDFHLTGGVVNMSDPNFWIAALLSIAAGFTAPLPYNYVRLRRYGKSCH